MWVSSIKVPEGFRNLGIQKSSWFHRICLLISVTCLTTTATQASDLRLVGGGSYNVSGSSVLLQADEILNNDFFGTSGTIRLELWAFSSPFSGSGVGYK